MWAPTWLGPTSFPWGRMRHERAVPTESMGFAAVEDLRSPFARRPRTREKCHKPGTQLLPLPNGVLPMTVTQKGEVVKVVQPTAAACTACHPNQEVAAHADTMTTAQALARRAPSATDGE